MIFVNTLDAQVKAVQYVIYRKTLEYNLSLYNDSNDPTGSKRVAIKTQIKQKFRQLDTVNSYLLTNGIKPLFYNQTYVDSANRVQTNWANESQIPGTVRYIGSTVVPPVDITNLRNNTLALIAAANDDLNAARKELNDAILIDESNAYKQGAVDDARRKIKTIGIYLQGLNSLLSTNKSSVPIQNNTPVDEFSLSIRDDIERSLNGISNYNGNTQLIDAAMTMRRIALDKYHEAKTPEDKKIAKDRLDRTLGALNFNEPINYVSIGYDENRINIVRQQFLDVSIPYYVALEEYNVATANLQAAIDTGDQPTIDAAQTIYDVKNIAYLAIKHDFDILYDKVTGVNKSSIPFVMHPGSDYALSLDLPPTDFPNEGIDPETSEVRSHIIKNGSNTPLDSGTGKPVPFYTGTDTAIFSDPPSQIQHLKNIESRQTDKAQVLQSKIDAAENNRLEAQKIHDKQQEDIIEVINKNNIELANTENSSDIDQIREHNERLQAQLVSNEEKFKTSSTIQYNKEVASAREEAAKNLLASEGLKTPEYSYTKNEATALNNDWIDATRKSNNAEENLYKFNQDAEARAKANLETLPPEQRVDSNGNPLDLKDKSNWSAEDRAKSTALNEEARQAHVDEHTAAAIMVDYNSTQKGKDALLKAGVDQSTFTKTGTDSINSVLLRNETSNNNTNRQVQVESQNQRQPNGFENINAGKPFYMQFPTLKSITDFHLRNGISPYGDRSATEIARNAIHFQIFESIPPASRAEAVASSPGLVRNIVDAAKTATIGSFTIYPTNDTNSLAFQHEHSYSSGPGVTGIISSVMGIVNGADDLLNLTNNVISSAKSGSEQAAVQNTNRKIDVLEHYESTNKQSMTIDFNLFTKDDFLEDVFKPLMFLTALSYPKRHLKGNLGDSIKKLADAANDKTSPTFIRNISNLLSNAGIDASKISEFINNLDATAAETGGIGPFRYFIESRPEFLSVRHASGLFAYPLAAIKSVKYEFQGPWYNVDGHKLDSTVSAQLENIVSQQLGSGDTRGSWQRIKDSFSQLGNEFVKTFTTNPFDSKDPQKKSTLVDPFSSEVGDNIFSGASGIKRRNYSQSVAYPSWAKCSITISNMNPLFRDDFMQLFDAASNGSDGSNGLVNVTQNQAGYFNDHPTFIDPKFKSTKKPIGG